MNWSVTDLKAYMTRRLAQEQRARERIRGIAVVQQLPVSLLREVLADPERMAQAQAAGWDIEEMLRIISKELPEPITEAQFQALATAKAEVCPWCQRPVEKVSEAGWYFYRHAPDAPKCQGMWTVMEEKP